MKKIIFTMEIRNFGFFQNGLSEKWAKKWCHHEKNRFFNYKFCFTPFWEILALYDNFWVTYAINLIKNFLIFPKFRSRTH